MRSRLAIAALIAAALWAVAGCGGSSSNKSNSSGNASAGFTPPKIPMQQSIGKGEGAVSLVNWTGYVEDGSNDPKVDWVHPFERLTGCKVTSKIANTSDEMVTLMRTGRYDGVSASGDATLRLIAGGDVAPVNTKLIPNYADVFPALKERSYNSVGGQMYGVPQGRGANILMWNPKVVKPAPKSWSVVFEKNNPYKGKVTAYDSSRTSASTGRTSPRSSRRSRRATSRSGRRGSSSRTCCSPTRSRSTRPCRARAEPGGRTRG
jgi:putative spermidine/putrescine transport system substrate-binding protein